jgi:hypothetical protein
MIKNTSWDLYDFAIPFLNIFIASAPKSSGISEDVIPLRCFLGFYDW